MATPVFDTRVLTPQQAVRAFRAFEAGIPAATTRGFNKGLRFAHRLSVTKFMVGGGKFAPVNPPPGPLRIRSGDLRRTVATIPVRPKGNIFEGGLMAGGPKAPYGPVHELGGKFISARPYLGPALEAATPIILRDIDNELQVLANQVIG